MMGDAMGNVFEIRAGDEITIRAVPADAVEGFPWVDMRDQMPVNAAPDEAWLVGHGRSGWLTRALPDINGITIHHTLTHDMLACAHYITRSVTQGGKGLPTTQYTFWVSADGIVSYCVDLELSPWHDNCGDYNRHISIGMA